MSLYSSVVISRLTCITVYRAPHLPFLTDEKKEMERIEQELAKAEKQLEKAEAAVQEFKEDDNGGKWLDELNGKQRKRERL